MASHLPDNSGRCHGAGVCRAKRFWEYTCIELARRGFVVLNIDAIGRDNSGIPNAPSDPDFDNSYGGLSALNYLRSLPNVNPQALGMMGHSLGAEMAYQVAMENPSVKALVITGFAYTTAANKSVPMMMVYAIV